MPAGGRVLLVGHSMGGMTIMALAAREAGHLGVGGGDVADDRTVGFDIHAFAGEDIPDYLSVDNHGASMNFGIEDGGGANDELMAVERDGAFHLAVNLQVFSAGELTLDMQAGTQVS